MTRPPAAWCSNREAFAGWAVGAARLAGSIRLQSARHPDNPWLTTLIGELSIKSAKFRTLWARHLVDEKGHGVKRIKHPVAGELTLAYEPLAVTGDDDHTLLVYQAEPDSPTAERLALLASWAAA
jgi:hypothetical protein